MGVTRAQQIGLTCTRNLYRLECSSIRCKFLAQVSCACVTSISGWYSRYYLLAHLCVYSYNPIATI